MSEAQEMAEQIKYTEAQLHREVSAMTVETSCPAQKALQTEQQEFLHSVLKKLELNGNFSPKLVIQKGLDAFTQVEGKAFVIQNILESVKAGRSLADTLKHYHEIGLTDIRPEQLRPTAGGPQPKDGSFLRNLWTSFKKIAGIIINMIVSACKSSLEMVGLKPSFGLAAGFPTISFTIEPESMNFHEILKTLRPLFSGDRNGE